MPPDVPSDIHDDEVEVTESRDVIETAEEVKGEPANGEDESALPSQDLLSLQTVSWFRQLATVLKKNFLLLSRRPVTLAVMLLSSIVSVLLAWAAGQDPQSDFGQVPLTDCGTISSSYYNSLNYTQQAEVPLSYNESWRDGLPVTLLAIGPLVTAIAVFLLVHEEMTQKMLGVLRGLGLRDSVYWASWWIPFLLIAFVNSLLGGIVAKFINVHVFQNVYFGGVFGSLFFLQIAMIGTSLFCAALCGSARKGAAWLILVMLVVLWIPLIVIGTQSYYVSSSSSQYGISSTPTGLFWTNANTTSQSYSDGTACDKPLISEEQGQYWKTEEERQDYLSSPEDFFIGCYFGAGYSSYFWNPPGGKFGSAVLFLFPYTHFMTMWSNVLGYTGMPGRKFSTRQASMSAEELAIASLPVPPDEANAKGTSLYPQGSTLNLGYFYNEGEMWYFDDEGNQQRYDTCPYQNASESFCPNINQCTSALTPAPTNSPSMNQMFGYLVVLAVLYTLIAAYWAQVFPGANGAPQKCYFFLLPSYWCGGRKKKSLDADSTSMTTDLAGVSVQEVMKRYGDFSALKGVSMQMERGEVTALLGHNGAGKTTLSDIICCSQKPTSGDVSVFGYSVTNDPFAVRNLVGVCKQDDYLYPDLSAKEHLELFAGLRGVKKNEIPQTVQKWLESVDLAIVQNQYASAYSGGMKRRLSVACSTIGDRPCIVLDEPTTGMDPLSRRSVWRHIDEIKDGRVILLTTHAMEEADLLCDMVAVMRRGDVAAYGTPLQLKSEYGSALQFALLVEREDVAATKQAILERFTESVDWVAVDAGEAGNITVKIQQVRQGTNGEGVDVNDLGNFVAWLESEDSLVKEYGFSNSSLEEVFLKVTEGSDDVEETDDDLDVCCPCCCSCCLSCCLSGPCRCCCRPKPHQHQSPDEVARPDADEEALTKIDEDAAAKANEISSFKPKLTVWRQAVALFRFTMARSWTGRGSIANWIVYGLFIVVIVVTGVLAAGSSTPPILQMVIPTGLLSLMLLSIISAIYSDRRLGLFHLIRAQGLLKRAYLLGTSMYSLTIMFAYGFVALTLLYATPMFRAPTVCPVEDQYSGRCAHNNGDPPIVNPIPITWWEDEYNGEAVQLYAAPTTSGYVRLLGAALVFALTFPGAVLSSSYVPGFKFALVLVVFIALFVSILPLAFFLGAGNQDTKELEQCASKICDVANLSSLGIDNIGGAGEQFLNCIGFDVNFSDSLGSLCLPPVAAILPQFGLFQTLAMAIIGNVILISEPPEYVEQVLVPSLGGDASCSGSTCQFPYAKWLYGVNLGYMALGAVVLFIVGVFLVSTFSFPSGLVLRMKNWVSHVFDKLRCRTARRTKSRSGDEELEETVNNEPPLEEVNEEREYVESVVKPLLKAPDPEHLEEGNEDVVIADHDKIPRDDVPPVLMYKLRKVYPSLGSVPPKVALASLDLHVPKGEVLGLLGKNGAGKTTALKILSISHKASSGIALAAGYDVSCEQIDVFERLGNCAQFDVVWTGQSVQHHLEFFARLKGLPKKQVKEISLSIAKAVGLGAKEVYQRRAGALSGGMRRRLSIAMSLIGAPSVLLLDEPSTGLDPSTRNSIWGLITSFATDERAIIITTHMMVEADALCNRIAIVSQGLLKVVGTQQHLKDEFGSGYLLQLNLVKSTPEEQESAMNFVRSRLSKEAVLQTKQAKTLHIALPRDIDLKVVFGALYSPESQTEGCINQFLLSQSSLEDVFIALGD